MAPARPSALTAAEAIRCGAQDQIGAPLAEQGPGQGQLDEAVAAKLHEYTLREDFDVVKMKRVSKAAGALCQWIVAVDGWYRVRPPACPALEHRSDASSRVGLADRQAEGHP